MDLNTVPRPCFAPRLYGERTGDYQEIASWWKERGEDFLETILPPLGVVVEHEGDRVAALWCYESYGIGVAFLELPCTRPGLAPRFAREALAFAEKCIEDILRHKGAHKVVRVHTTQQIAKHLERVGFIRTGEHVVSMIKRIDDNGN